MCQRLKEKFYSLQIKMCFLSADIKFIDGDKVVFFDEVH